MFCYYVIIFSPLSVDDRSESDRCSDDDWDGWDEPVENKMALCLFCDEIFESVQKVFDHCKSVHNFSISEVKSRFALDCFSFIRMINFLRMQKPCPEDLAPRGTLSPESWQADIYMKPVIKDDPLLMFDVESCEEEDVELDEETIILTRSQYNELLNRVKESESKYAGAQDVLQAALENMSQLKSAAHNLLLNSANEDSNCHCNVDDEINYFGAYAHFSIHHDMLRDHVRTDSYRKAIEHNKDIFKDKIVLDVGCGTGILSMFAVRAGAKLVIGVDQSEIIYQAMDIVRENKMEDRITLIKGRMEDVNLPMEHVDVIISEWMGYFLLFECMLDTVIYARDKFLRNDGHILPNKCTISLVGISDLDRFKKLVSFWDDVYGFKMSCMKQEVIKEASVELVSSQSVITNVAVIKKLDLSICKADDVEFTTEFSLVVMRNSPIVAFVAYFDVFFELGTKVSFSTSPSSNPTHWKQCIFYLEKPLEKNIGETIDGTLKCLRNHKDPRTLCISITVDSKTFNYIIQ